MPVKQNAYKVLIQNNGHTRSLESPRSGYQGNTEIDLEETYSEIVDCIHVSQDQWRSSGERGS